MKKSLLVWVIVCCVTCAGDVSLLRETGTIRFIPVEGGFYGIVADNGKHYDPTNLPAEFQKENLRVTFTGRILRDRVSFHMWGEIIQVESISELE